MSWVEPITLKNDYCTLVPLSCLNQAKASHKNIDLVFDYDPNIPFYVIGDHMRIHRIALELITNALNFTNRGFVKLTAQLFEAINKRNSI